MLFRSSSAANIGSWIAEDSLDNMTFFPVQLYETLTNTTTVEGVNATVS